MPESSTTDGEPRAQEVTARSVPPAHGRASTTPSVGAAWATADLCQTIVANANEGIWLIDREARTVFANDRLAQWLGEDARAMIGRPVPQFCFADDRETARARIASNLAGGFEEFPFRFRRRDGTALPVEARTSPARDASGVIIGALGLFTDLRPRQQAEHDLRAANAELARARAEAEARAAELEAIFQALGDGLMVHDASGALVRANDAGRALLPLADDRDEGTALDGPSARAYGSRAPSARMGLYAPRDAQGQPLAPNDWPLTRLLRGERLQGTAAPDTWVTFPDGRSACVNISGTPLRDSAGHVTGAVSIVRDVTAQRALARRTHETLEGLLALAGALVLPTYTGEAIQDGSGPESSAESARPNDVLRHLAALCRQVLATEQVAIIGVRPEDEVLHPIALMGATAAQERAWRAGFGALRLTERFGARPMARLRAGEAVVVRMRHLDRQDPAYILSDRFFLMAPLLAEGTLAGYIGANFGERAADYTPERIALAQAVARLIGTVLERDRLQHERELARGQVYALRETTRRMDEFMGIASHEIKTPITSVQTNLQLAQSRLIRLRADMASGEPASGGEARLESVLALFGAMQRQLKRQNRLVEDLVDAARISAGTLRFHFAACDLRAVVREEVEQQRAAWPNRTIHLSVPQAPVIAARADPDRLAQVLANYLINALKYSASTQPVAVRLRVTGATARIAVRDHGPGVAPGQRSAIWERYGRAPDTPIRDGSGVGLGMGLYISKTIVERHGGRVGVEKAPGAGSTFWFTLPLAGAAGGTAVDAADRASTEP